MLSKVKSGWAFLLALIMLCTFVIPNLSPKVQASTQAQITTAMGAGWNLGNQLEANINGTPSETAWGNPSITQALITKIKSSGFKTIRIPVSFLSKIGAGPSYTLDAAWLARIKEVIDYCYNEGLYIILDGVHGDGYPTVTGGWLLITSSDQTTIKAKYKAVWQQIATYFASYDEHLIFESMNEVFDGNYYDPDPKLYANINAYNQIFVDTVRQTGGNNGTRWLLIPGWYANIEYIAGDFGFVMPTDNYRSASIPSNEKRIMISAHYYNPWEFCGEESGAITQWGVIATDSSKKLTWCQEDYMESIFNTMYYKFVAQGYPVVIGEWGAVDKTQADPASNTYRQYFAKTLCTVSKKYGAIPVVWDNNYNGNYGFGLYDRASLTVTQQGIINSIMTGIAANVTPGPPPTPTPTPAGPGAKISIQYKCNDTNPTGGIRFSIQVQNDDTVTVPLSSVKVRYWYTRDDGKWQGFNCYYAVVGTANITNSMVRIPLSSQLPTVDFYAEVGFTSSAGSLAPGANSGEVQVTLNKYDNSGYNQTNDYSFNTSQIAFGQNLKVAGYVNGIQVFGTDPFGGPPTTPTPTTRVPSTPTPGVTVTPTPTVRFTVTPTPTVRVTPTVTRQATPSPTAQATPTPLVTPTPTRRVTGTATPTPTVRATSTPTTTVRATPTPTTRSGGYLVTYTISADWGSGANADVTIKNNTAIVVNGWTLAWTFPGNQTISNLWNGTYTQSGASVSVKDAGYNGAIGANGGTVSFGFGMNYSGTNAKPTSFTMNGTACQVQ